MSLFSQCRFSLPGTQHFCKRFTAALPASGLMAVMVFRQCFRCLFQSFMAALSQFVFSLDCLIFCCCCHWIVKSRLSGLLQVIDTLFNMIGPITNKLRFLCSQLAL